jgi:hypothetical protein
MNVTKYEMSRRKIVAALQSRITDVIGEFVRDDETGITFMEVVMALHDAEARQIAELIKQDWREGKC